MIPGLGAAVSLVAAVACAFFVTAAIVAFHRWPQVAGTSNTRALVVARESRRAPAIVVSSRVPTSRPAARTAPTPTASTSRPAIVAQVVATPPARRVVSDAPPTLAPAAGPAATPHPAAAPAPKLPPNSLAATTQTTTNNVSGVVNGVTNGLATTIVPVSPALANTVQGLGNGVSSVVISVGNSLAQLLLGLNPSQ